jgi:hypothetical protein
VCAVHLTAEPTHGGNSDRSPAMRVQFSSEETDGPPNFNTSTGLGGSFGWLLHRRTPPANSCQVVCARDRPLTTRDYECALSHSLLLL